MQPNTSLWRFQNAYAWADFHSCLYTTYYTISKVLWASPQHFHHSPTNNSIIVIPPTTAHNPNSLFPTAADTQRQSDCCMGFRGGAHRPRLWCAPFAALVRTKGCFAAHHFPMRSCHEKTSNHLSNSLYHRKYARIQSFKTHLLVVRL